MSWTQLHDSILLVKFEENLVSTYDYDRPLDPGFGPPVDDLETIITTNRVSEHYVNATFSLVDIATYS